MTNFKNLWSNKLRYTRLLNRLITVLLRVYLAPKRERLKREKKEEKGYLEKAQIGKLNENKWLSKVQKNDMHIAKYKELLQKERTTVNSRTTLLAMSDDDEAATLEIAANIHPIAAQEVTALEDEAI
ncbi:hypothetical protein RMATCC62417_17326 [Rhizopus microsporus]|nr:hypothetical protein RMATCC62417_17326 [Rhizopus microsporus]